MNKDEPPKAGILHFRLPTKDASVKTFKPKIKRDETNDKIINLGKGITVTVNTTKEVEPTYQGIRALYKYNPDSIIEFNPPLHKDCDDLGIHLTTGSIVKRAVGYGALNLSYKDYRTRGKLTDLSFASASNPNTNRTETIVIGRIEDDYLAGAHTLIRAK